MKLSSLKPAINFFLKARKILTKPQQTAVLIFDREGASDFLDYFPEDAISILDMRGESINMFVLLSVVLKHGIGVNVTKYALEYLRYVKPRVVVTFIDNTQNFYELKQHYTNAKFISVQNGWRDNTLFDILKLDKHCFANLKADSILCFGSGVADKYRECIDAEIIPIGSFKSNKVSKNSIEKKERSTVLFLSQYRTPVESSIGPSMPVGQRNIHWDTFYAAERSVLPFLLDYCMKNGFDLKVCGGSDNMGGNEEKFFLKLLGESNWIYLPRKGVYDSYKRVDEADYVVFIDSTLGFEALGRGAKAAAFSIRGTDLNVSDRGLGYHANLPERGPFWTIENNTQDFDDIMNFLTNVGDQEWKEISKPIISKIMNFDPGNSKFLQIMHDAKVPLTNFNNV